MEKIKLNICSIGDPTNPKTWSGTPFNLYSELLKMGRLGTAFNSTASGNKFINLISKIYYKKANEPERGLFNRYLNANKAKIETEKSVTNLTLHTGTLDLPFYKLPKNQKHFLFCDFTWKLWSSYSTEMNGYSKKLLIDAERLEKIAYHQMIHIFSISEFVKKNLVEHYEIKPEKITVVGTGLGVIKPFYGEKLYSNGKILFAAKDRFTDKGGHLVLEAFKIASQRNSHLELSIVGQNEYNEKLNIPNIKAYGFLRVDELQEIFNKSSLFLMPAINEPWGLVYLEALACKTPIIGLNRNSFPEISGYGNYGFGLDSTNPEELAEIILKCFDTPEQLKKMGLEGQAYCLNKFSWENTVSKIIKTIED